jgi:uncharacterized protein YegL
MVQKNKKGGRKADPVKEIEKLLQNDASDIEIAAHAADLADDEIPDEDYDDTPEADHTVTTIGVVIIDVSGSVWPYSEEVQGSVTGLVKKLQSDALTALGVRIAVLTTWEKVWGFQPAADFEVPELTFGSSSPLGRVTSRACELIEEEMESAAAVGRPLNKMLAALITDGQPRGESPAETRQGANDAKRMREGKPPLNFFVFKVGAGLPGEFLRQVAGKKPIIHAAEPEAAYQKIFDWLAGAIKSASMSQPEEKAETPELPSGLGLSIE